MIMTEVIVGFRPSFGSIISNGAGAITLFRDTSRAGLSFARQIAYTMPSLRIFPAASDFVPDTFGTMPEFTSNIFYTAPDFVP
jgi:hypothetical protein